MERLEYRAYSNEDLNSLLIEVGDLWIDRFKLFQILQEDIDGDSIHQALIPGMARTINPKKKWVAVVVREVK